MTSQQRLFALGFFFSPSLPLSRRSTSVFGGRLMLACLGLKQTQCAVGGPLVSFRPMDRPEEEPELFKKVSRQLERTVRPVETRPKKGKIHSTGWDECFGRGEAMQQRCICRQGKVGIRMSVTCTWYP